MILGIGTDIIAIERIEAGLARHGEHFAERILSQDELLHLPKGKRAAAYLAGRWAAKEAFVKALGTGFAQGIGPSQISITNTSAGAPVLEPLNKARQYAEKKGAARIHVSISHDASCAVAFVILEGEDHE